MYIDCQKNKLSIILYCLLLATVIAVLLSSRRLYSFYSTCHEVAANSTFTSTEIVTVTTGGLAGGGTTKLSSYGGQLRYLSYQPPGNGWNNQRIALEGAVLLAKLLNRTLIVHPLSSHSTGEEMKRILAPDKKFGHVTYNKMQQHNLLPLSYFLDMELLSEVVPVIEHNSTHSGFVEKYSALRWHRVCHSVGFGYWADRHPTNDREKQIWNKQVFTPTLYWRGKCPIEMEESKHNSSTIVKVISDFKDDDSDILYIEEGTLFGIQFRFLSISDAMAAQDMVVNHVRYNKAVYERAGVVKRTLGSYNAIHVRRVNHVGSQVSQENWIIKLMDEDFLTSTPLYVATDEPNLTWFRPFVDAGFKLYFASNFNDTLKFSHIHESVRQDYLGIHEQVICELSDKFLPTEHSTFSVFVKRIRKEVSSKDGLYTEGLHSFWMGHTTS